MLKINFSFSSEICNSLHKLKLEENFVTQATDSVSSLVFIVFITNAFFLFRILGVKLGSDY